MKLWTSALVAALVVASVDADAARRLGSGRSIGRQSPNVTQREATRPPPSAPNAAPNASPNAAPAQQGSVQPANPAVRPGTPSPVQPLPARRPWGAMLGGLAAGLGLAWLAHSLGFGPAM